MSKVDIRTSPFRSIAGWRGDSLCCPQAFGGDAFSGCTLNCFFCFCREMEEEMYTKYYSGWDRKLVRQAEPEEFRKLFARAFDSDKPSDNWLIRCLRHGLPFNLGSKAETFAVPNNKKLIQILKLFLEYKVPVIFETKTVYVGLKCYLDIIQDLNAAVIVSIMGGSDTLNYKLEPNAPPASSRWQLVRELNRLGVWCGVRWEPIMPSINSATDILKDFADKAHSHNAKHVSLYNYRSSNYYAAAEAFTQRGYNYVKMLEGNLDENWRPIGKQLFGFLREARVPASSPDFVNFPFDNSCISCCGTDKLFVPYHFTFQYACHLIKTKGQVSWGDMEAISFREPKSYDRMKGCWNGKGQVYSLRDSPEIRVVEVDENGMNVYGRRDAGPASKVGLGIV